MRLEARMLVAYQAGRTAATAHDPWDSNPHDGAAATAVERVLSLMWRRGYSSATPQLPAGGAGAA